MRWRTSEDIFREYAGPDGVHLAFGVARRDRCARLAIAAINADAARRSATPRVKSIKRKP